MPVNNSYYYIKNVPPHKTDVIFFHFLQAISSKIFKPLFIKPYSVVRR